MRGGPRAPQAPARSGETKVSRSVQWVTFALDEARYAVSLAAVDEVVRMVEIAPLPKAPAIVTGVVNVRGEVVAVVDPRVRFRLPAREIALSDHMLIARTARRRVALAVDAVHGVIECAAGEVVAPHAVAPGLEYVEGIVRMPDGLVYIHDLDKFLALDEEAALQEAMGDA
jgi:purine-binding chemotaxis protein CheW